MPQIKRVKKEECSRWNKKAGKKKWMKCGKDK